jgi:hypothetical protein
VHLGFAGDGRNLVERDRQVHGVDMSEDQSRGARRRDLGLERRCRRGLAGGVHVRMAGLSLGSARQQARPSRKDQDAEKRHEGGPKEHLDAG